jgi:hypothetical protein
MKQEQTDAMERAMEKAGWMPEGVSSVYRAGFGAGYAAALEAESERLVSGLLALRSNGKVQFDINDDEVFELLVGQAALEAGKAVDENGLKPCPFCGGEADLLKAKPDDAWPEDYVTCKNHDCDIFGNYSATVESWNRRAR